MKAMAAVLVAAMLVGCTSRTEFGECIGIGDDKKPDLVYKLSAWNLALAFIFIELIVPPVVVAVDKTFCPIGRKDGKQ